MTVVELGKKTTYFEGKVFNVIGAPLITENGFHTRQWMQAPPVVAMLAALDGKYALVNQFRVGYRNHSTRILELPAGKIDPGEDGAEAARRELREEIGYDATRVEHWEDFYSTPGISDEKISLYYCSFLVPVPDWEPDVEENIRIEWWSFEELIGSLGFVHDAKTLAGIAHLAKRLGRIS